MSGIRIAALGLGAVLTRGGLRNAVTGSGKGKCETDSGTDGNSK